MGSQKCSTVRVRMGLRGAIGMGNKVNGVAHSRAWVLGGSACGACIAIVLTVVGCTGGESREFAVYITTACNVPMAALVRPMTLNYAWWLYVCVAWTLQAAAIGAIVWWIMGALGAKGERRTQD